MGAEGCRGVWMVQKDAEGAEGAAMCRGSSEVQRVQRHARLDECDAPSPQHADREQHADRRQQHEQRRPRKGPLWVCCGGGSRRGGVEPVNSERRPEHRAR